MPIEHKDKIETTTGKIDFADAVAPVVPTASRSLMSMSQEAMVSLILGDTTVLNYPSGVFSVDVEEVYAEKSAEGILKFGLSTSSLDALVVGALTTGFEPVRRACLKSLATLDSNIATIVGGYILGHEDPAIRASTVQLLRDANSELVEIAGNILKADSSRMVREESYTALIKSVVSLETSRSDFISGQRVSFPMDVVSSLFLFRSEERLTRDTFNCALVGFSPEVKEVLCCLHLFSKNADIVQVASEVLKESNPIFAAQLSAAFPNMF